MKIDDGHTIDEQPKWTHFFIAQIVKGCLHKHLLFDSNKAFHLRLLLLLPVTINVIYGPVKKSNSAY